LARENEEKGERKNFNLQFSIINESSILNYSFILCFKLFFVIFAFTFVIPACPVPYGTGQAGTTRLVFSFDL